MNNRSIAALAVVTRLSIFFTTGLAASAETVEGDPSTYRKLLHSLKPGDTLTLKPGRYSGLDIVGLNGRPDAWITISGQAGNAASVIVGAAGRNTVEILNSSYVAIENLEINSLGLPGVFGISAKGHEENTVHHIRIESNTFIGQNGSQQTDGISTKTPTWGWIIRYNRILGAGTGLYLGDSDETQPFVAGLIENNLIQDTIGYGMQVKDQLFLPSGSGLPTAPVSTIIRNNVFIKSDQPSPDGNRPNLLLGSPPEAGSGSLNTYEVYGNLFLHNHHEALLQASGRVSLHDNIFVDGPYTYPAIVLRSQNRHELKVVHVYNNTVYTSGPGIYFGTKAEIESVVVGNLVLASKPISGQVLLNSDNLVDSSENAQKYIRAPSFAAGPMDFYPLPGQCQGSPIDLSLFRENVDYTLDFNGDSKVRAKGGPVFRGAYAGDGMNPGWPLQVGMKTPIAPLAQTVATLVRISPETVQAGSRTRITLIGADFTDAMTVVVSGQGVEGRDLKLRNPTEAAWEVDVDKNVRPGMREVTIRTSAGASNALKLRIQVPRAKSGTSPSH